MVVSPLQGWVEGRLLEGKGIDWPEAKVSPF